MKARRIIGVSMFFFFFWGVDNAPSVAFLFRLLLLVDSRAVWTLMLHSATL